MPTWSESTDSGNPAERIAPNEPVEVNEPLIFALAPKNTASPIKWACFLRDVVPLVAPYNRKSSVPPESLNMYPSFEFVEKTV